MKNTATMNISLPLSLNQELESLAKSTKRSKSFCITEAIKSYLETQSWQIQAIKEGIASAENGRLVNHSNVKEWIESWDTEYEKVRPECG
ncbi:CopG family ribbon-helix-helix protein [Desulfobacterales bacterium HSG17]|nr:CopG family ribbon-helix-helix protein [Desulfobacterales bacterium HSG17]